MFITVEGIEGAGKTTLANALADELAGAGCEVVVTEEPGGGAVEARIRGILLDPDTAIADRAELLLFEASRAHHVENVIKPALARGAIVICDRFADSSTAYQGFARGIGAETVRRLNEFSTGGLKPDLTILLDLPAQAGLARQVQADRISSQELAFHEAVRSGYLALAKAEPDRFVVIDATQDFATVLREAIAAVESARSRRQP